MKSVEIRSFFWPVFSCIQSEYRKIRTRKSPYLGTFHAVILDALRDLVPFVQLKNVKNAYGGVMLKVSLHRGCFSLFSNCTNGTKLRKVFHIVGRASDMRGLAEKGL